MLERMYGITPQEELPPVAPEIPDLSITIQENEQHYGRFVVEPLERGWGVTLGNPLRRSLLNSLSGTAVTWVKVIGALHEYTTIPHMREEVVEFLLNIKGIRIRSLSDRPGRLRLEVDGEGEVGEFKKKKRIVLHCNIITTTNCCQISPNTCIQYFIYIYTLF